MSEFLDDMPQSALAAIIRAEGEQARLAEQLAAANARIAQVELDDRVRVAAAEAGVPTSAIPDVLNRSRAALAMKDGRVTGAYGETVNLRSWTESLRDAAPHLWESSSVPPAARPAAAAPKPGPVASGNVKRAAFDQMNARQKHDLIDAVRAGRAVLVD